MTATPSQKSNTPFLKPTTSEMAKDKLTPWSNNEVFTIGLAAGIYNDTPRALCWFSNVMEKRPKPSRVE